jgi:hypothetical protein
MGVPHKQQIMLAHLTGAVYIMPKNRKPILENRVQIRVNKVHIVERFDVCAERSRLT